MHIKMYTISMGPNDHLCPYWELSQKVSVVSPARVVQLEYSQMRPTYFDPCIGNPYIRTLFFS